MAEIESNVMGMEEDSGISDNMENKETGDNPDNAAAGDIKTENSEGGDVQGDGMKEWEDILGSGCIMKKTISAGQGESTRPVRGDQCEIRIRGWLDNGADIDCEETKLVTLGECDVVPGIDLSLTLMELGEISGFEVKDRFGYGEKGRKPDIPPNTTLHYEVELKKVLGPLDITKLSADEKLSVGDQKRSRGNEVYSREEYSDAISLYSKAISILDDHHNTSGEPVTKLQEIFDLKLKCYNNLAAAQLKIEAYDAALKSCDSVLRTQPKNVKALFRKGKVLGLQGQTEQAIKILKVALENEPEAKIIHQELSRLVAKQRKENEKEKEMYRRMFGTDDNNQKPHPTSSSFGKWGVFGAIGAAATALAGILLYKFTIRD